jgi:ABC-2 type transport system permease protein
MRTIVAIGKRELSSTFNSPIAYLFLLVFAGAALVTFFQQVWSIGQVTLRPLFQVLPLLLLVLVPALTMRLWAEERKLGTLELLMTMPVRDIEAVLGKFFASLAVLALGLGLTLGAPITMAWLGDVDAGPVVGAYLGALLLGASYLSIGQLLSSLTENQVLALLGALIACFLLWMLGEPFFTGLFPADWQGAAAICRDLGAGARFRSIARGVIDLRDVTYYLAIIVFCLSANTLVLKARREG